MLNLHNQNRALTWRDWLSITGTTAFPCHWVSFGRATRSKVSFEILFAKLIFRLELHHAFRSPTWLCTLCSKKRVSSSLHGMCVSSTSHTEQPFDKVPWSCLVFQSHIHLPSPGWGPGNWNYENERKSWVTQMFKFTIRLGPTGAINIWYIFAEMEQNHSQLLGHENELIWGNLLSAVPSEKMLRILFPIATFRHVYAITEWIINTKGHLTFSFYTYFTEYNFLLRQYGR